MKKSLIRIKVLKKWFWRISDRSKWYGQEEMRNLMKAVMQEVAACPVEGEKDKGGHAGGCCVPS